MAIVGLTVGKDGVINTNENKVAGRVVSGEKNAAGLPKQLGFFKIKQKQSVTKNRAGRDIVVNEWVVNETLQKILCEKLTTKANLEAGNINTMPTRVPIRFMNNSIEEVFDTSMIKFTSDQRIDCQSFGEGTLATRPKKDEDTGDIIQEEVIENSPCKFRACKHYKEKQCKAQGTLKFFLDLSDDVQNFLYHYEYNTSSLVSIVDMNATLERIYQLLQYAHNIKEVRSGQKIPFTGLFGIRATLVIKPAKVGGFDTYTTSIELRANDPMINDVMATIGSSLDNVQKIDMGNGVTHIITEHEAIAMNVAEYKQIEADPNIALIEEMAGE